MFTEIYIADLLVNVDLADQVWGAWDEGLLSEPSIPWNREQTDSLTQVITEACPRYHTKNGAPYGRHFD